ncbi:MAG: tRNA (adenosine(37)-N6)-threonylcarbamoyltransferase complex transferase subunit TsaD [Francisellaceae bacterium]|jgi:N6-L-threonylcarbamoyladenine synthase|nr:tRNA (adenosine(37)-N6)-threonylcarbamoyltransferase complex transferase subunit TsaD [Francisellaceae bacterium]
MLILGIETSCDDTGIGIYGNNNKLLAHTLYSQIKLHAKYGGTVPELASRDHVIRIQPLIHQALKEANCNIKDITGIAYTQGPGLAGSLLVGASFAKSLAYALKIPALGVHHLEGHLLAPILEIPDLKPPFLALLVSGGHTMIIDVDNFGSYKILGETLDDAAGEAFDKTARLLELGFPGGPAIESIAKEGNSIYNFPRPMCDRPGLDFSFSGLKTFTRNTYNKTNKTIQDKANISRCFQEAVADTLVYKLKRALNQTQRTQLVIAGGVSANQYIKTKINHLAIEQNIKAYFPHLQFCTDNGAMIAFAGYLRMQKGQHDPDLAITIKPRWAIDTLSEII